MVPVLAFFVALGAATAIYLLNADDPAPVGDDPGIEEVLEISPALPRISLLPGAVPQEHDLEEDGWSGSLLEGHEWQDEKARRERRERSLAEVVREVRGLGVLVEPAADPKKEKR